METLHLWVTGICFAAVICAVVTVLTPSGALEKSIKSLVSVFLICAMIMPFFKEKVLYNNDSSIFLDKSSETADNLSEEIKNQTEAYLKSAVEEALKRNGIKYSEVVIEIDICESSVSVKSVTVSGVEDNPQTVKDTLFKETGVIAEVVQ